MSTTGLRKLLQGVLKYRTSLQPGIAQQLQALKETPQEPKAVVITCVDTRILNCKVFGTEVGEIFTVRNAGALVPSAALTTPEAVSTEPGVLELACAASGVKNVIVMGHSDCKAMNCLHGLAAAHTVERVAESPLQNWLMLHGQAAVDKLQAGASGGAFTFSAAGRSFSATLDPALPVTDQLSQISTLQQVENVASHAFMTDLVAGGKVLVHAAWYDAKTGDVWLYSREKQAFCLLTDESLESLLADASHGAAGVDAAAV